MRETDFSVAEIGAAERLVGVTYSAAERQQMLDNIEGQIALTLLRRTVELPNSAPMATRFDPRLSTTSMPAREGRVEFLSVPLRPLPSDEEDIAFASVSELSAWIASGSLTSRRLTDIYIDRIAALGARLECFAIVTPELARVEADAADALLRAGVNLGPLHGIPYGVKDIFDTKGIATAWGAEPFRERIPDADAAIVKKLRAAGAVLLGKTALGALAYGDIWYGGQTRNPWNLNEGASGSSAGSAAATAGGLCAFAIGTETLGSITSPSQRCGTTGLRPTFGRVSRAGAMTLCWTLDKVGPICRSVEDTALVLSAINGFDAADRSSIGASFSYDAARPLNGLRLGYLPDAFSDPEANDVDRQALKAARGLGIEVIETSLPDLPYGSLMNILYAEAAAAFEELTLSGADDRLTWQDADAWPNIFRKARFLSAVDHIQLDRLRHRVMEALDVLFQSVDVLIGPFMTGPMLVASNFTGHPCLHLRSGFRDTASRGRASLGTGRLTTGEASATGRVFAVPQGISLWGRLFDEGRLLNVGMALEKELGVAARRPSLAS